MGLIASHYKLNFMVREWIVVGIILTVQVSKPKNVIILLEVICKVNIT